MRPFGLPNQTATCLAHSVQASHCFLIAERQARKLQKQFLKYLVTTDQNLYRVYHFSTRSFIHSIKGHPVKQISCLKITCPKYRKHYWHHINIENERSFELFKVCFLFNASRSMLTRWFCKPGGLPF